MKMFISYSTADVELVRLLAAHIEPLGEIFYWGRDRILDEPDWPLIFRNIADSQVVLALITDNTVSRGIAVGNEIGYAMDKGKLIIPIVTDNVNSSQLGCLKGVTPAYLNRENPGPAMAQVSQALQAKKGDLEFGRGLALGAVIVGTLWMLSSGKN
jgi:hypothetical protein